MTWTILLAAVMLLVAGMLTDGASASGSSADEKIVPVSVSFDPYGNPVQPQYVQQPVYEQVYQPVYEQSYKPAVPYNEAHGPPNYGNKPGPGSNDIAPGINPYPRLSHCVITGYPCNSSQECCTYGCDVFGPSKQCCIPEGQACDFSRPVHPNNYACCYPLHCDPYKKTGVTICQERIARFPDAGMGGRLSPEPGQEEKKLPFPWYSDENPRYADGDELEYE